MTQFSRDVHHQEDAVSDKDILYFERSISSEFALEHFGECCESPACNITEI